MDEKNFESLLESVRDMGSHMRGNAIAGAQVKTLPEPNVKAIRERTGLSQAQFAYLIGIKPKTLQNWEQRRVRPAGPARALFKIVEANPKALLAIHKSA